MPCEQQVNSLWTLPCLSLLQSPNLKPLFIAHTEKDISQFPPGGVFVLPQ